MSIDGQLIELDHVIFGRCRLVRVEGMTWVIERVATGTQLHIHLARRGEFSRVQGSDQTALKSEPPEQCREETSEVASTDLVEGRRTEPKEQAKSGLQGKATVSQPVPPSPPRVNISGPHEVARLRRAIESLRNGLPPQDGDLHRFTVGLDHITAEIETLFRQVDQSGGGVKVIRGQAGHGKSLSLSIASALALENGFWVSRIEVDATENRLDRPSQIYRDLMRNLKLPAGTRSGVVDLAERIAKRVQLRSGVNGYGSVEEATQWLRTHLDCRPLAWLFSDPMLPQKQPLMSLLAGDRSCWREAECRKAHCLPGKPRDWPALSASNQGDYVCYLLSGLGRTAKLLGDKGLVLMFDEMEKWQNLSWIGQSRASNLVGGLIWGATEVEGRRERGDWGMPNNNEPEPLEHSLRGGGFPFTTKHRSHVGLLFALTPRGESGPEEYWKRFGPIEFLELREFTAGQFRQYLAGVASHYSAAYALPEADLGELYQRASGRWRAIGDGTTRSAVRSVIETLDEWRRSIQGC